LQLQENGDLQELYTKWWEYEDKDQNQKCVSVDEKKDSASELSLESVGGVFVIMAVGIFLALIVAIVEFVLKAKKTHDRQVSGSFKFLFYFYQ
jgi:ionotropic glutamate receptor